MTLTVIVPTYNRVNYLEMTLASLLRQGEIDILVVDDGSTDKTKEFLAKVVQTDHRIRVIHQENGGVTKARITGLDNLLPNTEFVTFLDDDDVSPEGSLETQLAFLKNDSDLDLTYGNLLMVEDINPNTLQPVADTRRAEFKGIHLSCAILRRRLIDKVGTFDPDMIQAEDTDYLIRIFETAPRICDTETICLYHRRHPGNMTKRMEENRRSFALALLKSIKRKKQSPDIRMIKPAFDIKHIGTMDFY